MMKPSSSAGVAALLEHLVDDIAGRVADRLMPAALLLSQRTVEAVTGIPASIYLERVKAPGFPVRVIKIGKLRLVDCGEFVAWLKAGTRRQSPPVEIDEVEQERRTALEEIGHDPGPVRPRR